MAENQRCDYKNCTNDALYELEFSFHKKMNSCRDIGHVVELINSIDSQFQSIIDLSTGKSGPYYPINKIAYQIKKKGLTNILKPSS